MFESLWMKRPESCNDLIRKYTNETERIVKTLWKKKYHPLKVYNLTLDDMYSFGLLGTYKAVLKYDLKTCEFNTFLYLCVNCAIVDGIREFLRNKNKVKEYKENRKRLDDEYKQTGIKVRDKDSRTISDIEFIKKIPDINRDEIDLSDYRLTADEEELVRELLTGELQKNICIKLGISRNNMQYRLAFLRRKLFLQGLIE